MVKSVILIHGLFMSPSSWGPWVKYLTDKGFKVYAPGYPFHEGEAAELRGRWEKGEGKVVEGYEVEMKLEFPKLTLEQVVERYVRFIDGLEEKPIAIGHSMGGLVAQKLLALDKVAGVVAVSSAAPKGVACFKWSFIKANLPVVNPLKGDSLFMPNVEWFNYGFCNNLSREDAKKLFDQTAVPESRNIPRSSTGAQGAVDFKKAHAPLLFIGGENDHIVPCTLNESNFEAYKDKNSVREMKIFAGRDHSICLSQGWEEVASFICEWLAKVKLVEG